MVARPESPTIDRPLKPLVVTEGETAKFMVKIRGEPTPSVTWYVNNAAVYNVSSSATSTALTDDQELFTSICSHLYSP